MKRLSLENELEEVRKHNSISLVFYYRIDDHFNWKARNLYMKKRSNKNTIFRFKYVRQQRGNTTFIKSEQFNEN